jgi:hypothetical protein
MIGRARWEGCGQHATDRYGIRGSGSHGIPSCRVVGGLTIRGGIWELRQHDN